MEFNSKEEKQDYMIARGQAIERLKNESEWSYIEDFFKDQIEFYKNQLVTCSEERLVEYQSKILTYMEISDSFNKFVSDMKKLVEADNQ